MRSVLTLVKRLITPFTSNNLLWLHDHISGALQVALLGRF